MPIISRGKVFRRKRGEVTSENAASAAARVLAGTGSEADARTAAASALTQKPNKKKPAKGKKKAKKKVRRKAV